MLSNDLKRKIDSLWDKFWSNGMSDHMNAQRHISYLFFMKKLEDHENNRSIAAKHTKKKYESAFDDHDAMRWSVWKNYNGEKMLTHVREKVFPFLKNLKSNNGIKLDLGNSTFEIGSPILLQDAVQAIDDLKISQQNLDTQGDIYEYVTSKLKQSGLNGGFRTPRHIIRMMVKLLDPDVNQKICDPASGTGGFLVNAYLHILKKYTSKELVEIDEEGIATHLIGDELSEQERDFLLKNQFYGFDFEMPMIQICQMNMILHGFHSPNIKYGNSLGKQFEQNSEYDIIFANPPFAGSLNKSEINENFAVDTKKTELLFIELFCNKLTIGGRAAVIVPTGILADASSSKAILAIKKLLLEKCQLDAIIYLPSGVFKPYTGHSTSVLLFTKGGKTEKVWLYEMKNDGFKLDTNHNIPIEENDIPDILTKFRKRETSDKSVTISMDEIIENDYDLNVRRYIENPIVENQIDIQNTINELDKLTKGQKEIESQVNKDLKKLGFKV